MIITCIVFLTPQNTDGNDLTGSMPAEICANRSPNGEILFLIFDPEVTGCA
jgi:hypothetical protein